MSENGNGSMNGMNGRPHALLRAGFPFYTTLGNASCYYLSDGPSDR